MKITIKIKYLLGAILAVGFLSVFTYNASAEGPRVYVRYAAQGDNTVLASVYWDDSVKWDGSTGYSLQWANKMLTDASDLAWTSDHIEWYNKGTKDAYVNISLQKHKNYYFKISRNDDISIVRAFPGDLDSEGEAPNKKSSDYAHGNFTPDTTMCGSCHDTHSSIKSQLLKQSTYYDLCMLCHSNSNSQSKYDVEMGRTYMGFQKDAEGQEVYVGWKDSLGGPIGTGVASSAHDINDNFNTTVNVPGGSSGSMLTFTCISCHTAHGGTNDNYRLLRKEVFPSNSDTEPIPVDFKAFAIVEDDNSKGEQVYLNTGASEFCLTCHTNFAPGSYGDGHSWYEHPVTVGENVYSADPDIAEKLFPSTGDYLPLQYNGNIAGNRDKRTAIVCQTCHFAHGTRNSYVVNQGSWGQETPPSATTNTGTGKHILRLDNYGVCQSCHKK